MYIEKYCDFFFIVSINKCLLDKKTSNHVSKMPDHKMITLSSYSYYYKFNFKHHIILDNSSNVLG